MLLRISLSITILASAAIIGFSHFTLRPRMQQLIAQRDQNAKERELEKSAKLTVLNDLKTATAKLKQTETALGENETKLAAERSRLAEEQKRRAVLNRDLEETRLNQKDLQHKLAQWESIPVDPSQVKGLITSQKALSSSNDYLKAELTALVQEHARLTNLVASIRNPEADAVLPAGLRGKVLAVDPKWNFVVLDIGEKDGAAVTGVLVVSRNSKLLGKVRITDVQSNKSIANFLPGWNLAEVMEGDQVFYIR